MRTIAWVMRYLPTHRCGEAPGPRTRLIQVVGAFDPESEYVTARMLTDDCRSAGAVRLVARHRLIDLDACSCQCRLAGEALELSRDPHCPRHSQRIAVGDIVRHRRADPRAGRQYGEVLDIATIRVAHEGRPVEWVSVLWHDDRRGEVVERAALTLVTRRAERQL